jgi:DNA-binding transcriptional ArsR family regulator
MLTKPSDLDAIFHALADRNRRFMLCCLTSGPASVTELASKVTVTLPAAVQHLRVLEATGIVESEKVGRVRTYRQNPERLRVAEEWIASQRRGVQRSGGRSL